MMPQRKGPRSGGHEVALWLEAVGIGVGEYQQDPKPWWRRGMVDPTWPDKIRVFCCISLHTAGYGSEVAVIKDCGKARLLTRADIARETGLPGNRVRRGVAALESDGWVQRRSASGKEDLERGDIEIHVYGTPKAPQAILEPQDAKEEPVASFPDGLPDELLKWLKRAKVHSVPAGDKLERAKVIAHEIATRETELLGLLRDKPEGGGAQASTGPRAVPVENEGTGVARVRPRVRAHSKTGVHKSVGVIDSNRKKNTAAAAPSLSGNGSHANSQSFEFPAAAAAIQQHFPATEDTFANKIAEAVVKLCGTGTIISDDALVECVEIGTRKNQRSAALYLDTVPQLFRNLYCDPLWKAREIVNHRTHYSDEEYFAALRILEGS